MESISKVVLHAFACRAHARKRHVAETQTFTNRQLHVHTRRIGVSHHLGLTIPVTSFRELYELWRNSCIRLFTQ